LRALIALDFFLSISTPQLCTKNLRKFPAVTKNILTGSSSSRVLALKHCLEIRQMTLYRERLNNYIVNIHHLYDVYNKVMEDEVHCSLVGNSSLIQTEGHHLPAE